MPYLWLIPLLVVIIIAGAGYYFARVMIFPANQTYEDAFQWALDNGHLAENEWENLQKEPVIIHSDYGYDLSGYYLPKEAARGTVIVSHGITSNLVNSLKYAKIFLKLGFSALVYDHRNHGKSGGGNTTFGYYEADDLCKVIDWLQANKPGTDLIGIHGESMGAAIGLLAAAKDERVAFMVADCGYASLVDQAKDRLRIEYHLPYFPLVPLAFYWAKLLSGMQVDQIAPEEAITQINAPVMIIHGEKDAYIFPAHAHRLAQADPDHPRHLWLAPEADHAEAFGKNMVEYPVVVETFLKDHQLM